MRKLSEHFASSELQLRYRAVAKRGRGSGYYQFFWSKRLIILIIAHLLVLYNFSNSMHRKRKSNMSLDKIINTDNSLSKYSFVVIVL